MNKVGRPSLRSKAMKQVWKNRKAAIAGNGVDKTDAGTLALTCVPQASIGQPAIKQKDQIQELLIESAYLSGKIDGLKMASKTVEKI